MKSWREIAAPIISKVLRETEGQPKPIVDKALFDAYPFGQRAYHPYKIWLDEIKRQRNGTSSSAPRKSDLDKLASWEAAYGKRTA
jgi:hypothetical protein